MKYFQLICALVCCLFIQSTAAPAAEIPELAKASAIDEAVDAEILAEITTHAPEDAPVAVVRTSEFKTTSNNDRNLRPSLTPMLGGNFFAGRYDYHVGNSYSLGLALELPVSRMTSFEIEAGYSDSNVTYSGFIHDFSTHSLGTNVKVYLVRDGIVRPYVGTGFLANHYTNMFATPAFRYNHWIGSGQLLAGTDIQVERQVAVGVRAGWVLPVLNRADVKSIGAVAAPGYEDAAVINKDYFRILGTVKITM